MSDSHVYVRSKDHHWVPARVVGEADDIDHVIVTVPQYPGEQQILSDGGKGSKTFQRTVINLNDYTNKVLPLQNVDETGRLNEEKDMVDLPFLHEAAILYNLKSRHVKGKPYTRTGDIVIAVNPYTWITSLYTPETRREYARKIVWEYKKSDEDVRKHLEPHVYETSALSYKGLALDGLNQSILVSGESGAGKTETVKIAMNHIAMIQGGPTDSSANHSHISKVVQRVVDSNPLLEAFGNAKTCRNDNSSRFGKYLQLQFESQRQTDNFVSASSPFHCDRTLPDCRLAGSICDVYLLEKSRVVYHAETERNFHIFYQILDAPDKIKTQFWDKLQGKSAVSFNYVGANATKSIEGKSDAEHFQSTLSALELVGIKGNKLHSLMRAIVAVMQLGNISFTGCADKSAVSNMNELSNLADVMGIPTKVLRKAFTQRTIKTRGETVVVDLNPDNAKESCDALAKAMYHGAFLWLVNEINCATKAENNQTKESTNTFGVIGLLDIFGFECFAKNGFEQLCINYANEKLQHKFTEDIFRQVQEEYKFEGLALEDIRYDDNHEVLDLIESRMGLLAMLNEECVRPGGSDSEFVFKAIQQNSSSPALIVSKKFSQFEFGICHYAGNVKYVAENFIAKNNDTLGMDLKMCISMSTNSIIAEVASIGGAQNTDKKGYRNSESSIVAPTVWTKYKQGLHVLMNELHKTNSRYIRCIKPNEMKAPGVMQHGPTLDQLRSAGVIAAVTITRSVFPNRLDHESVLERFKHMDKKLVGVKEGYAEQVERLLHRLLKHMNVEEEGRLVKAYAVGKTRTYFRAGALEFLEAERIKGFDPAAIVIQKIARGFVIRKRQRNQYILNRRAAIKIQSATRMMLAKVLRLSIQDAIETSTRKSNAATLINTIARGVVRRMKFRKELKRYREITALKNEYAMLQLLVRERERMQQEAVKEAEERMLETVNFHEQNISSVENSTDTAKLLDERNALIEKMRNDNKVVRTNIKLLENKFKRAREQTDLLKAENDRETETFLKLNEVAKEINAENMKESANQEIYRKQITSLVEELKKTQVAFHESSDARLQCQRIMAEIIKKLRTECKDEQLIEDAIFVALGSDTEASALKASFDAIQAHSAERKKGIQKKVIRNDDTEHTEDSSSCYESDDDKTDSAFNFDEEEYDRETAEMESELLALTAELGM